MNTSKRLFNLLSIATLLGACGGGGGGGGGQTTPSALPPAAITAGNATQVAGAAVTSIESRDGGTAGGRSTSDTSPSGGGSILSTVGQVGMSAVAQSERQAPTASSTKTVQCSSGSVTGEANDADNSGNLTKGDAVNLTFNQCFDNANNSTVNGSVRTRVTALTGSPLINTIGSSITLDMTFTNFSISQTQAGVLKTVTINGNLAFTQQRSLATSTRGSLSTTGLTISGPNDTVTLTNFALEFADDDALRGFTISGGGTVSSQKLNGSVTVDIPKDPSLVGTKPNPPDSGKIRITGKDSSLVVEGIGSGNVRLDVDTNNDGKIDNQQIVAWKDLP
jgi:hypothetical protein